MKIIQSKIRGLVRSVTNNSASYHEIYMKVNFNLLISKKTSSDKKYYKQFIGYLDDDL